MAGKPRAGKNSRVAVGSTNLNKARWNVDYRGDDLDTTSFEDAGYETGIIGVLVATWSLGGDWDAGRNAFDSPPGLYPRSDLVGPKFYENVTDNILWNFTLSRVLSARNSAEVRGKVLFEAEGKSNGTFAAAVPTGSV